jgi:hypothetical protein
MRLVMPVSSVFLFFPGVIVRKESAVASVFPGLFSSPFSAPWSTTRGRDYLTESNPNFAWPRLA